MWVFLDCGFCKRLQCNWIFDPHPVWHPANIGDSAWSRHFSFFTAGSPPDSVDGFNNHSSDSFAQPWRKSLDRVSHPIWCIGYRNGRHVVHQAS